MRVRAWGPSNLALPCVPHYVDAFEGAFTRTGECLNDMFVKPCSQVEVAEGHWVGVRHDGTAEAFRISDEENWRAKTAMAAVQAMGAPGGDPEHKMAVLRASAELVGLDLPELMEKLEEAKSNPKEDLVEVFKRTWKKPEAP